LGLSLYHRGFRMSLFIQETIVQRLASLT
jgi:hypothetical protein